MQCRKCGNEISGDEYRMVAEWPFCLTCFERLLSKPEPPPVVEVRAATSIAPAREAPPAEPAAASSTEAGALRCLLCERELAEGQYERLASWVFCPSCYGTLVSMPDDEEEPAAPRPKKSPLVPPKYAAHKSCKGCGRRIPERAAKEIDGEPYCPDCYTAKARSAVVVPEIRARVDVSQGEGRAAPAKAAASNGCESCGRDVAAASLKTVEGFAICEACLSTDADLALHLARKRHQLYLERLKNELE